MPRGAGAGGGVAAGESRAERPAGASSLLAAKEAQWGELPRRLSRAVHPLPIVSLSPKDCVPSPKGPWAGTRGGLSLPWRSLIREFRAKGIILKVWLRSNKAHSFETLKFKFLS